MEPLWVKSNTNETMDPKWRTMLTVSFVFHLALFSLILFVPDHMPTRRIKGTIYEVNLVELPATSPVKAKGNAKPKTGKPLPSTKKTAPAKRISSPKKNEKPIVIAKRTVTTNKKKVKKQPVSPSKFLDTEISKIEKKIKAEEEEASKRIDRALSEIEKQVKTEKEEEEDHVERAISELGKKGKGVAGEGYAGDTGFTGIAIEIYKREVEDWIKSNWTYPVALTSPKGKEDLEAVVIIKAKSDGSILKYWFAKKSFNVIFDESVQKAVEHSDPLPRFPPGYRVTHEEFEITFNLSEMEG